MRPSLLFTLLSIVLTSCGGGGSQTPADSGPVAYYSQPFFRGQHPLSIILFEGGLVYGFYQSDFSAPVFPQFAYSGFFVLTKDAVSGESTSYSGVDFNFDEKSADAAALTVRGPRTPTLLGELSGAGSGGSDPIDAGSAAVAKDPTITATLEGDYAGYIRSIDRGATVTASMSAERQLFASTSEGCQVTATLKPRELGNLYDTEATLGANCPSAGGSYRGHAFQSYLTRNVYLMLTDEGLKHGVFVHLFDPPTQEPPTVAKSAKQGSVDRAAQKTPF